MSAWVRLWDDMPNDPKWRVIARRSGRPVSEVMAVFLHMMTNAGRAKDRGTLEAWCDEDVAISIDAESDHVAAIREAMQGKTLEGERLSGWAKRQPSREDGSADRARAWRERTRTQDAPCERKRTQANAPEEKREDTEIDPSLRSGSAPAAPATRTDDPKAILADVLEDATATDIVAHRKALRSPLTAGAARQLVKALVGFGDPEAAAAAMLANGWKGFRPEWMTGSGKHPRAGPRPADGMTEILRNIGGT